MRVLFARHNVRVYRFVLRCVGDETLAEDTVSEVFTEVWCNAARFEGRSEVLTWLLSIARFKALSTLRRRKDMTLDEDEAAAIPDLADDPEVAVQKKDRVAILRECMSRLSRNDREIIDLVYYHEKSVNENRADRRPAAEYRQNAERFTRASGFPYCYNERASIKPIYDEITKTLRFSEGFSGNITASGHRSLSL